MSRGFDRERILQMGRASLQFLGKMFRTFGKILQWVWRHLLLPAMRQIGPVTRKSARALGRCASRVQLVIASGVKKLPLKRSSLSRPKKSTDGMEKVASDFFQKPVLQFGFMLALGVGGGVLGASRHYRSIEVPNPYREGQLKMQNAEFQAAAGHFREALRLNPENPAARVALAGALHSAGDFKEAKAEYAKADEWTSEVLAAFYTNQVTLHQHMKNERGVLESLRKLAAYKPQDSDVRYRLGSATEALGDSAEALSYFEQALRLNPQHAAAAFAAGQASEKMNQRERAREFYRIVLRIDSNFVGARERLAAVEGARSSSVAVVKTNKGSRKPATHDPRVSESKLVKKKLASRKSASR